MCRSYWLLTAHCWVPLRLAEVTRLAQSYIPFLVAAYIQLFIEADLQRPQLEQFCRAIPATEHPTGSNETSILTALQFHFFLNPVSSSECEKARHTARFPTIHRLFPTSKHYLVPKSTVLKLRNPGLNPQVFLLAFLDKPLAQSKSQNFRVKFKPTFIWELWGNSSALVRVFVYGIMGVTCSKHLWLVRKKFTMIVHVGTS